MILKGFKGFCQKKLVIYVSVFCGL